MSDVAQSAPAPTQADQAASDQQVVAATDGSAQAGQEASASPQEPQKQTEGQQSEEQKFELKLPENALLDAAHAEELALFAKEKGLTQDQAQAQLEREHTLFAEMVEAHAQAKNEQTQAWFEQVQNDRELGGAAFKENAELVKRTVESFFPESIKKLFNETGLGNHPDLFRGFLKLSKLVAEDKRVESSQVTVKKSLEERLYGSKQN